MKPVNPDSYCGIYCGSCSIMTAGTTGRDDRLASFWDPATIRKFLASQKILLMSEKDLVLECGGCKSDSVFINCRGCKIRECAITKKVDHCNDCGEFPCKLYTEWKNFQTMLPHLTETEANLDAIKTKGTARWIEDQEKKWACPGCGTGFSWYAERCGNCGKDLKGLTHRLSRIKSFILKTGINMMALTSGKR